jgi:hypothetical protein
VRPHQQVSPYLVTVIGKRLHTESEAYQ